MIHPHQLVVKFDGTVVLAEQLIVGDELPSPLGKSVITRIERIPVKEWCEVFLHGGPSLMVSPDHAFADDNRVLEDGVRAGNLTLDTALTLVGTSAMVDGLVRIRAPAKAVSLEMSAALYYIKGVLSEDDRGRDGAGS